MMGGPGTQEPIRTRQSARLYVEWVTTGSASTRSDQETPFACGGFRTELPRIAVIVRRSDGGGYGTRPLRLQSAGWARSRQRG